MFNFFLVILFNLLIFLFQVLQLEKEVVVIKFLPIHGHLYFLKRSILLLDRGLSNFVALSKF